MNQQHLAPARQETKGKRGGTPGNQNARKHGFYSSSLDPAEICRFWNIVNLKSVAPEIAVLTVKLRSLLQVTPANHRALSEAVRLLTKWYSAKYRLDKTDSRYLQKVIRAILENGAAPLPAGMVPAAPADKSGKTNRARVNPPSPRPHLFPD